MLAGVMVSRTHGVTRIYLAAKFVIVWDSSMGRDNRHRFKRRSRLFFSDIFRSIFIDNFEGSR